MISFKVFGSMLRPLKQWGLVADCCAKYKVLEHLRNEISSARVTERDLHMFAEMVDFMMADCPEVAEMFGKIGGFDAVNDLAPELFMIFEETVAKCCCGEVNRQATFVV